jgi:hypothetical protein
MKLKISPNIEFWHLILLLLTLKKQVGHNLEEEKLDTFMSPKFLVFHETQTIL